MFQLFLWILYVLCGTSFHFCISVFKNQDDTWEKQILFNSFPILKLATLTKESVAFQKLLHFKEVFKGWTFMNGYT